MILFSLPQMSHMVNFYFFLVEEISALFASLVEIGRHFQLKIVIDKNQSNKGKLIQTGH